ncbi:MAG: phage baseplate assembly protein V [Bacteroidales bacterium]|nr:phage baseplate assembly protein V [Bacteroidales bacterium]
MDCSLELGLLKPAELRFTIRREDAVNKTEGQVKLSPITDSILGKNVVCSWTTVLDNNVEEQHAMLFEGIAVEANADKLHITVVACSKDILLNDAPCCESYTDKSVSEVIKENLGKHSVNNNIVGGSLKKEEYIVRYNETSYQFITRLARQYGLWVYWSLKYKRMVVSDNIMPFEDSPATSLLVKKGYQNFTYKLKTMYPYLPCAVYDYLKDNIICNKGGSVAAAGLVESVDNDSKTFFIGNGQYKPINYYDYYVKPNKNDAEWLKNMVESHENSLKSQYVECTGTTNFSNLQIGSVIAIIEDGSCPAELVVIGMRYEWDSSGNFIGKFTAIPKDQKKPPYFDPGAYPKSGVQRAVVVDNKDDQGLGRVKVQFLWQATMDCADNADINKLENKDKKTISPWIRVAQPYAGKGVGCYIIPEIGDEVLIGFEHDNVEKPYVIGVLYHGGAAKENYVAPDEKWTKLPSADKKPNVVKALRTRSGQTIEIHDDCDEANVQDKNGFVRIYTNPLAQNNGGGGAGGNNPPANNPTPREYDIVLSKDEWRKANDIDKALTAADAEKVKIGVASDGSIVISCAENLVLKAKNVKIIADETFDMSVAGKTGGKWNDNQNWKDTEFGTKVSISKEKMEILAVGTEKEKEKKGVKMYVPAEQGKAAQTFGLTVGNSSVIVNGTKDKEEIGLVANEGSYISVIADKDKNGIDLQANKDNFIAVNGKDNKIDVKAKESLVTIDGKNGAEKIDVKAKGSFVTVDGKNGAEKIDVKAKESLVTVDGKNGAEKIDVKAKGSGVTVDGNGSAVKIDTDGSIKLTGKKNFTVRGVENGEINASKSLNIDGGNDIKMKGNNAEICSNTKVKLDGTNVELSGKAGLLFKGREDHGL